MTTHIGGTEKRHPSFAKIGTAQALPRRPIKSTAFKYLVLLIFLLVLSGTPSDAANITIQNQYMKVGYSTTVNVSIDTIDSVYGYQMQLGYNNSVIRINNITEGNFLRKSGKETFFCITPTDYILNSLIGYNSNLTGNGTMVTINLTGFTATHGTTLSLGNVILINYDLVKLPYSITNSTIIIVPRYDVNSDGIIDMQDLRLISNNVGTTNLEYDLNDDGVINIKDIVVAAKHYGEVW